MSPLKTYESVCDRCGHLSAIFAFLDQTTAPILQIDELLRAEWASRVSALDLYIHELVAQGMSDIFQGKRKVTSAYSKFQISNDVCSRLIVAPSDERMKSFDLEVRTQLGRMTFQAADDIADGIRLVDCNT